MGIAGRVTTVITHTNTNAGPRSIGVLGEGGVRQEAAPVQHFFCMMYYMI